MADDRGAGPIRRNGPRFNGAGGPSRTGPYERAGRDQRWGREGVRMSPPPGGRGRGIGGGASRWADGAAGQAAVGPREAVQGRSLKSYEDLDAVGGGAGSELNY